MESLFNLIDECLQKNKSGLSPCIIAIDGMSGSGKSTLASLLALKYDAGIIHTDDFFLRPEQRTAERLDEPGGNFDRERFEREVLGPLAKGENLSFYSFDCKKMEKGEERVVKLSSLIIVEGSYSMHPYLLHYYDLKIFLETDKETQKKRILKREGKEKAMKFFSTWVPLENKTFETFKTKDLADYEVMNFNKDAVFDKER